MHPGRGRGYETHPQPLAVFASTTVVSGSMACSVGVQQASTPQAGALGSDDPVHHAGDRPQAGRAAGFAIIPRRWAVERTFAWLTAHRRLVRDYERDPRTSEAMIR